MLNLTPEFWLQTAVYLIGGTSAVIAVAFRIGQMDKTFATKGELNEKVKERNEKFDGFKSHVEQTYVRKDMCNQMHQYNKEELEKIEETARTFRHEIMQTVQKIFLTLEQHNDKFSELKELILKK